MRHHVVCTALLAAGLSSTGAWSQVREEDDCLVLKPGITSPVEMATCAFDLPGSKLALDKAFAELRRGVPADHRRLLDKAQRAWIAHRTTQCLREAGGTPGSTGHSSAIIGCTAEMNRERATSLRSELKDRW